MPKKVARKIPARKCLVEWTPKMPNGKGHARAGIRIREWNPPVEDDAYLYVSGACESSWHDCPMEELYARIMVLFNSVVVRDEVDVMTAHREFLKIKEYSEIIAPDSPR